MVMRPIKHTCTLSAQSNTMKPLLTVAGLFLFAMVFWLGFVEASIAQSTKIEVKVANHQVDQPQLFGVPVPKGELYSPDHVRVLNSNGQEIASQITKVSTWAPADESIKWLWVFFFTDEGDRYSVEYGDNVRNGRLYDQTLSVRNNQRPNGEVDVNTGPLRFVVRKGEGGGWMNTPAGSGFLDMVQLDLDGDGFEESETIATGIPGRGSFLDLVNDEGEDVSKAVVIRTVKELGSGPLHAIIRIEGEYHYSRPDHPKAPFLMRIQAFAGKSYIKIDHTFVYTGKPDKSPEPQEGYEYHLIATQKDKLLNPSELLGHPGWTQPHDQIQAAGMRMSYNLSENVTATSAISEGSWWNPSMAGEVTGSVKGSPNGVVSLLQMGPNPSQVPPLLNSSPDERFTDGFEASFTAGNRNIKGEHSPGWLRLEDEKWGIGVAFSSFFEEYPKELTVSEADGQLIAYSWTPAAGPLSFAREDGEMDSEMIANFATGLAKSTELFLNFYPSKHTSSGQEAQTQINALLNQPVAVVSPDWFAHSQVFGKMAPSKGPKDEYERGLDYKFEWMKFNQNWEPWYGMLNYGDFKTYYYGNEWQMWTNNEPANDYMWWLQFARTGNPEYKKMARAVSRHTMDVDNVHWPKDPVYFGDTNESVHAFEWQAMPKGSPYIGMGRRHAEQHFTALLSAHVWVAGWVTSYYMDANLRGLDVARLTADYYVRRPFGEHGLRGRRLYLSIWNLAEVVDATKDPVYQQELEDRIHILRELQYSPDQGGSIVIDRYGYSQIYVANGLRKVLQMTENPAIRTSILDNARRLRDLPPLNHDMESYLSSISSLLLGYEQSGEQSLLDAAVFRARYLKTGEIPASSFPLATQREYADALESVSEFPKTPGARRPPIWQIANGLRIFGWTSIYQVPYLNYWIED